MGIFCPKCGSDSITAQKKGFSGRKAVAGALVTGGIGLLAGTLGSNKVKLTCLSCGNQFNPGEGRSTPKSSGNVNANAIDKSAGSWSKDVEELRAKSNITSNPTRPNYDGWILFFGAVFVLFLVYQCT